MLIEVSPKTYAWTALYRAAVKTNYLSIKLQIDSGLDKEEALSLSHICECCNNAVKRGFSEARRDSADFDRIGREAVSIIAIIELVAGNIEEAAKQGFPDLHLDQDQSLAWVKQPASPVPLGLAEFVESIREG